jgi:hypothetical protein
VNEDRSEFWSDRMYDLYAVLISVGCYGFIVLLRAVLERV